MPFQYSPLRSVSFDVQHLSYPLIFVDFDAFVIYLKSFCPSREVFITCNIDPPCLPQMNFPVRCGSFRHIQNALFIPMLTNVAFGLRACVFEPKGYCHRPDSCKGEGTPWQDKRAHTIALKTKQKGYGISSIFPPHCDIMRSTFQHKVALFGSTFTVSGGYRVTRTMAIKIYYSSC